MKSAAWATVRLDIYRREAGTVEGWCSAADLTRWGCTHAPVVMANEAHSGLARCIRTREVGIRIIQAAHQAGVRRLAMEALPRPADNSPGPIHAIPPGAGGYLAQPEMIRLITTALELGWSLWAYEARFDPGKDQAELLSMEFTNWRDREQARNLCQLLSAGPAGPLLVWCGNSHASRHADSEWVPMGHHFAAMSGIQQFVIDQAVTIDFTGDGPAPGLPARFASGGGACWAGRWLSSLGVSPGGRTPARRRRSRWTGSCGSGRRNCPRR